MPVYHAMSGRLTTQIAAEVQALALRDQAEFKGLLHDANRFGDDVVDVSLRQTHLPADASVQKPPVLGAMFHSGAVAHVWQQPLSAVQDPMFYQRLEKSPADAKRQSPMVGDTHACQPECEAGHGICQSTQEGAPVCFCRSPYKGTSCSEGRSLDVAFYSVMSAIERRNPNLAEHFLQQVSLLGAMMVWLICLATPLSLLMICKERTKKSKGHREPMPAHLRGVKPSHTVGFENTPIEAWILRTPRYDAPQPEMPTPTKEAGHDRFHNSFDKIADLT